MSAAAPQPTPTAATIESPRAQAAVCERCELYLEAEQTVFGEGPVGAQLMLVGEQPGDREDRAGHPFVGLRAGSWMTRWHAPRSTERTST